MPSINRPTSVSRPYKRAKSAPSAGAEEDIWKKKSAPPPTHRERKVAEKRQNCVVLRRDFGVAARRIVEFTTIDIVLFVLQRKHFVVPFVFRAWLQIVW
jgi:hypothetical protein